MRVINDELIRSRDASAQHKLDLTSAQLPKLLRPFGSRLRRRTR
jgi:hypothetical protein